MGQVGECNGYYLGITNQYKPIKYHPKESRELIIPSMVYNGEPLTFYYQLPFVVLDEKKIIDEQSRGFIFPPLSRYFDDKIFEIMEAWEYYKKIRECALEGHTNAHIGSLYKFSDDCYFVIIEDNIDELKCVELHNNGYVVNIRRSKIDTDKLEDKNDILFKGIINYHTFKTFKNINRFYIETIININNIEDQIITFTEDIR